MASIQHEADRKYKEECAEYWRNLLRKHLAGEPLTEEEERHLDGCRPVGPFHQEPAFGSPEAVEQASETIRGMEERRWAEVAGPARETSSLERDLLAERDRLLSRVSHVEKDCGHLTEDVERLKRCLKEADGEAGRLRAEVERLRGEKETLASEAQAQEQRASSWQSVAHEKGAAVRGLEQHRDALGAERDRLREEVAALRQEKEERERADAENAAACQEIARRVDAEARQELAKEEEREAEVRRLRAEVERLSKIEELEAGIDAAARRECLSLAQHRDALAEALLLYTTGDDCGCCDGSPDQPQATPCAYCVSMAALRKAGR